MFDYTFSGAPTVPSPSAPALGIDTVTGVLYTNPAGGVWQSQLQQSQTIASATPAMQRVIVGQATLSATSIAVAASASIVGVRGVVQLNSGSTITAGFLYGMQGKLTVSGTLNNGSGFNAGVFGQLDTSNAGYAHTSGYLAPIMGDYGATSHLTTDSLGDMVCLLNTTTCLINSIIKTEAKAAFLFDLNDLGQGQYIVATAKGSGWDKSLKINLNGTTYYIPCNSAAS